MVSPSYLLVVMHPTMPRTVTQDLFTFNRSGEVTPASGSNRQGQVVPEGRGEAFVGTGTIEPGEALVGDGLCAGEAALSDP